MNIFAFIKSLSRSERVKLSEEVNTTVQYLTHAASRRRIGFDLAKRIKESEVNAGRPSEISFSDADWNQYQIDRVSDLQGAAHE